MPTYNGNLDEIVVYSQPKATTELTFFDSGEY